MGEARASFKTMNIFNGFELSAPFCGNSIAPFGLKSPCPDAASRSGMIWRSPAGQGGKRIKNAAGHRKPLKINSFREGEIVRNAGG